jgi:hypothetical protein
MNVSIEVIKTIYLRLRNNDLQYNLNFTHQIYRITKYILNETDSLSCLSKCSFSLYWYEMNREVDIAC